MERHSYKYVSSLFSLSDLRGAVRNPPEDLPNLANVKTEMEIPSSSTDTNPRGTASGTEMYPDDICGINVPKREKKGKAKAVNAAGLNQRFNNSLNGSIKGVTDFGMIHNRRSREMFLTFEASRDDYAKHLFKCLKEIHEGSILVTRLSTNGRPHPRYVHAYVYGKELLNHDNFKLLVEHNSGLRCLEVKKVVSRTALLKSMMPPKHCPLLLSHKIPKQEINRIRQTLKNLKTKKETANFKKNIKKNPETITIPDDNENEASGISYQFCKAEPHTSTSVMTQLLGYLPDALCTTTDTVGHPDCASPDSEDREEENIFNLASIRPLTTSQKDQTELVKQKLVQTRLQLIQQIQKQTEEINRLQNKMRTLKLSLNTKRCKLKKIEVLENSWKKMEEKTRKLTK